MAKPLFSIAIPAFKYSFLKECIDSVLSQSYSDFELVIVNDNSPEDIDSIVLSYSDPRIVYKKNAVGFGAYNVSKNWDECLNWARGDYFMCIGDDDKLLPDCLGKYLELIQKYPQCHIYHARTHFINEKSEIINYQEARPLLESAYSMIWHRWFSSRKTFIGDFLFRTEYLKQSRGFIWRPFAWGSDEQTVYLIASQSGIANMQDFGFQYRVNSQTISYSTKNYKGKIEAHKMSREWFADFLKDEPSNPSDHYYWKFIKEGFNEHFLDLYRQILKDDFCYNRSNNLRYWLKCYKSYGLSLKDIIFCYLIGIKKRISLKQ